MERGEKIELNIFVVSCFGAVSIFVVLLLFAGRARCGYRGSEGEEKRNIYLGTKLGGRHWAVSADIGRTHVHFPQTDKNSTFKDKIWGRSLEML